MTGADVNALITDALAARSGGATARELATFLGLEDGPMTLHLRELEKQNLVESFGQEFHSGRDAPEPVWRLKA